MLPKNRRISKKEFSYILSKSKRYTSENLLLYIANLDGKTSQVSRFSFSVSKKVAKTAVKRNRQRRRGYSVVGRHINSIKDGSLLFFSFKKGGENLASDLLEKEIIGLLSTAGVLS